MSSRLVSSRLRHLPGTVYVLVRKTGRDELAFVLPRAPDVQKLRKLKMVMAIWRERLRSNGSKAPRTLLAAGGPHEEETSQGLGARAMLRFCREGELSLPGRYEYRVRTTRRKHNPPWRLFRTCMVPTYLVSSTCGCTFPRDSTVVKTISSVTYGKPLKRYRNVSCFQTIVFHCHHHHQLARVNISFWLLPGLTLRSGKCMYNLPRCSYLP